MPRHVPPFPALPTSGRLTLDDVLGFVSEYHLKGLACYRPFMSNRRAWSATSGSIVYATMTEPDVFRHVKMRGSGAATGRPVGAQTIKHDLKLLTLCDNIVRRWKKKGYTVGGYNFATADLPFENPATDVKRPATKPRKRPVTVANFAKFLRYAPDRLRHRAYFALDTGLNPIELKRLRVDDYNAFTNCLYIQRGKSGEVGTLPVSDRCRAIIADAIKAGREFILDFTNEQRDIEGARKRSGVEFWFGRDLRCTYYNEVLKRTGRNYRAAQRAMLHRDHRTGPMHYEVDDGADLRGPINGIGHDFSDEKKIA